MEGVLSSLQSIDWLDACEFTVCKCTVPASPCGKIKQSVVAPCKECEITWSELMA